MSMPQENLVLIVDDEEMNLIVLSKILKRAGFEVVTAADGEEAVKRSCEEPKPSVILMDLMMPKMNGWDATKIIKEKEETRGIPIVAVTALSNERDNTLAHGFDGFCPKPIDFDGLINEILGFLEKSA